MSGARPYLDSTQLHVLHERQPPLAVLAGPGAGKTTLVTEIICQALEAEEYANRRVLAVTFSRAGVARMQDSLFHRMQDALSRVDIMTTHSLARRLINAYQPLFRRSTQLRSRLVILDNDEAEQLIMRIARDLKEPRSSLTSAKLEDHDIRDIQRLSKEIQALGDSKSRLDIRDQAISFAMSAINCDKIALEDIAQKRHYLNWLASFLKKHSCDDYSAAVLWADALMLYNGYIELSAMPHYASLFSRLQPDNVFAFASPYALVLYDEFQDASEQDFALLEPIFRATKYRVIVLGDPFQTIFHFRRAMGSIGVAKFIEHAVAFSKQSDLEPTPKTSDQSRAWDRCVAFLSGNYRNPSYIIQLGLDVLGLIFENRALAQPKSETHDIAHALEDHLYNQLQRSYESLLKHLHDIQRLRNIPYSGYFGARFNSPSQECEFAARMIQALVSQKSLDYGDIAIVIPDDNYLAHIEKSLSNFRVPYHKPPKSIWNNIAVRAIVSSYFIALGDQHAKYGAADFINLATACGVPREENKVLMQWVQSLAQDIDQNTDLALSLSQHLQTMLNRSDPRLSDVSWQRFAAALQALLDIRNTCLQSNDKSAFAWLDAIIKNPYLSFITGNSTHADETTLAESDENGRSHTSLAFNLPTSYQSSSHHHPQAAYETIAMMLDLSRLFSFAAFGDFIYETVKSDDPLFYSNAQRVGIYKARQVKGLEFKAVLWLGVTSLPYQQPQDLLLAYTIITRARSFFFFSFSDTASYSTFAKRAQQKGYGQRLLDALRRRAAFVAEEASQYRYLAEQVMLHSPPVGIANGQPQDYPHGSTQSPHMGALSF